MGDSRATDNRWIERGIALLSLLIVGVGGIVQLNHRFDKIEFNQELRDTVLNNRFDKQYEINNQVREKLQDHDSQLRWLNEHIKQQ